MIQEPWWGVPAAAQQGLTQIRTISHCLGWKEATGFILWYYIAPHFCHSESISAGRPPFALWNHDFHLKKYLFTPLSFSVSFKDFSNSQHLFLDAAGFVAIALMHNKLCPCTNHCNHRPLHSSCKHHSPLSMETPQPRCLLSIQFNGWWCLKHPILYPENTENHRFLSKSPSLFSLGDELRQQDDSLGY